MTLRIKWVACLLIALGTLQVGCDGNSSPTAVVVEELPPAETIAEEFSGTIALGTTSCHFFSQVALGDVRLASLRADLSLLLVQQRSPRG